jgi:hypothetical protein
VNVVEDFCVEGVDRAPGVRSQGVRQSAGATNEEWTMTQYMLSVWHTPDEVFPEGDELQARFDAVDKFNQEVQAAGIWVFGGGLEAPSSATVVRGHTGDVSMTDGPFAEAKEQIGGFWIIEAPDLDAALDWARRGSEACGGPVEVRPFQAE